mmetsp:Transcript_6035/g.20340  ORF Transcript_6035/g.20340 Transcript_6035/m.20340 type:complete len:253 (+) Transcript_6035:126-884(+)
MRKQFGKYTTRYNGERFVVFHREIHDSFGSLIRVHTNHNRTLGKCVEIFRCKFLANLFAQRRSLARNLELFQILMLRLVQFTLSRLYKSRFDITFGVQLKRNIAASTRHIEYTVASTEDVFAKRRAQKFSEYLRPHGFARHGFAMRITICRYRDLSPICLACNNPVRSGLTVVRVRARVPFGADAVIHEKFTRRWRYHARRRCSSCAYVLGTVETFPGILCVPAFHYSHGVRHLYAPFAVRVVILFPTAERA